MLLGVAIAGALGAATRYVVEGVVQDRVEGVFPWGTWVINVSGSLVLGLLTGLVLYHGLGDTHRIVIGAGFLGAYTTFSTWMFEIVRLFEDGSRYESLLNAAGSMAAGLAAAAAGLALAAIV
ncbi:MAG: fluoride efflux transporter CrcB [Acidimicrobiia bacterium]